MHEAWAALDEMCDLRRQMQAIDVHSLGSALSDRPTRLIRHRFPHARLPRPNAPPTPPPGAHRSRDPHPAVAAAPYLHLTTLAMPSRPCTRSALDQPMDAPA